MVMSDADRTLLAEGINLVDGSIADVRTLSYLLHPPFLDQSGLLAAVRWYAKGFADRSGIAVDLEVPATFERLPQDVESTLFRVVQEALTNIHRHARTATACIWLRVERDRLVLEITDRGRGMSADVLSSVTSGSGAPGVGLAGMRERLKQLGGALHVESNDRGTTLRATVPLPEHLS
jgi:signal transduction histidine kinase